MNEITQDIGENYEIVVTELTSHVLPFVVYGVLGRGADGKRVYNREGYTSSPDPVEDRAKAQKFIDGSLKWDGCINFTVEDQPLHFCSRSDVEEFNKILPTVYDLAAKHITSWEGD